MLENSLKIKIASIIGAILLVSSQSMARDWVVDQKNPKASDKADGTMTAPLKTISAAALKAEPGDRVLVRPGIYREAVAIPKSGRPGAPIVYESEVAHKAILCGSDPAPDDLWKETAPGIWWTAWPGLKSNRYGNGEWVYANGTALLRIDTMGKLLPGKFKLDFDGKGVFVMLAAGKTPSNTKIDLAKRDGLFHPGNWTSSQRYTKPVITDIVIRGFKLRHNADWHRGYGAIRVAGERWLVENNKIKWCTAFGIISCSANDCVVRGNTVEWTGVQGIGGTYNIGLKYENNIVRYGNYRLMNPSCEGGGSKFCYTLDSYFTGNHFELNYGSGFWLDWANANNYVNKNKANDNFGHGGFFSECSWHDMYVENISAYNEVGILIGESAASIVTRNIIVGNSRYGLRMRGNHSRRGTTWEGIEKAADRLNKEVPNLDPIRLDRWKAHRIQYSTLPNFKWILNDCAAYDNIFYDNNCAYTEHRIYGEKDWHNAAFIQNFSDRNIFWTKNKKQALFGGPAKYVYPDGIDTWKKVSNRDAESVVADPRSSKTKLPKWAQGNPIFKEAPYRLNTELAEAGYSIVRSPETAILYYRLRRSKNLEKLNVGPSALRACRFDMNGESCVAIWATEARGRYYSTAKLDQDQVVVESSRGNTEVVKLNDGVLDLAIDYRPVYIKGIKKGFKTLRGLELSVRKFNNIGDAVPITISLTNDQSSTINFNLKLSSSIGFLPDKSDFSGKVDSGKTVSFKTNLIPKGEADGSLFSARLAGTVNGKPIERIAQFSLGEGAGVIPQAKKEIKVDGEIDDWGDLAKTTPLVHLADFKQYGFGDLKKWGGQKDFSAKLYAAWTAKGIYWLAIIDDDSPLACPDGIQAYESDAIELFIDGRSPEMQWEAKTTEGTAQVVATPALDGSESKGYLRPKNMESPVASKKTEKGYLMEGFIPFDPKVFPAEEWEKGRAVKMAIHFLDRDDKSLLGQGYTKDLVGLGWGISWQDVKGVKRIRSHCDTSGWKTLILSE